MRRDYNHCWACGKLAPSGVCAGPHPYKQWRHSEFRKFVSGGSFQSYGQPRVPQESHPCSVCARPVTGQRKTCSERCVRASHSKRGAQVWVIDACPECAFALMSEGDLLWCDRCAWTPDEGELVGENNIRMAAG